MAVVLVLAGCSTIDGVADAACPESPTTEVENYPSSIILPPGSVIEQQTHGQPPEYASDNYIIVANVPGTQDDILSFYRCALPRQNLSIISEEQGNILLIRFAGEGIDEGSITLNGDAENGRTRVEIFVIENPQ
tara:strand:+ start:4832 stop:5233 length:402 start_codon:yes stop_codon:yes gene_type:complete